MTQKSLIDHATQWVIDQYPYNSYHLLNTLEWLDRIAPGAREAVRLAALTHDMERAFPGPDQPVSNTLSDPEYYRLHSERSARIVGAWFRERGTEEPMTRDIEELIRLHEVGGSPEANLVQAADSISFLDVNIDLFLKFALSGKYPVSEIRWKFNWSYDRIQVPHVRELAFPLRDRALVRLEAVIRPDAAIEAGGSDG
jgi:HD domain-containing protein